MSNFYKEPRPDWDAIAAEVNRIIRRSVAVSLVINVARGWTKSKEVYDALKKICPELLKSKK